MTSTEIRIPARDVKSLCWHGDVLVDWVAGAVCYNLDGRVEEAAIRYAYVFDAAIVSPSGEYEVIYTRRGTKGVLLHQGKQIREINRSYYYADAYEYPIALFRLKNGQEVMAHCPDRYNRLEIDDLATGERLTQTKAREPTDYFFSRLATDSDGAFLLSAGWHWHPVDQVKVFSLEQALKDPAHLDGPGVFLGSPGSDSRGDLGLWGDESSACFGEGGQLIAWIWEELDDDPDDQEEERERKAREHRPFGALRTFDPRTATMVSDVYPQTKTGTMRPLGQRHVVGFYEFPKVFDLQTGAVIHAWPHIQTGKQTSSIIWGIDAPPVMAFDARNLQFAVADKDGIVVVQCTSPI